MPQDLDLSYLDIVPDDRDPQAIFDAAIAAAQQALPTWVPRNGNPEVVLMEAMSLAVADAVYALNRIPPVVLEAVLALYGVPRGVGDQAVGEVTITFDDTRSLEIVAGTELQDPLTGITMYVRDTTTVTDATSATVTVVATESGAAANQIPAGTSLDIIDLIPYATDATVTAALAGGTDPESDSAYFDRASTVLARVTSSLVVPTHFTAYALQDTRITRATTVDLYDATDVGSPGDHIGHVSVFLYGVGAPVAAALLDSLETDMQALSAAMITVHVAAADIATQNVELTVTALAGYDTATVQADVEAAIRSWMNPATWTWDEPIRVNDIITVAGSVDGVDFVDSVTTPAADVTIDSPGGLAEAGTVTVTVN